MKSIMQIGVPQQNLDMVAHIDIKKMHAYDRKNTMMNWLFLKVERTSLGLTEGHKYT